MDFQRMRTAAPTARHEPSSFEKVGLDKYKMSITKTDKEITIPQGKEMFNVSKDGPQWFNVRENPLCKSVSQKNLYDSLGTVTRVSKATGAWVTFKSNDGTTSE
jgi:hypothetical protein